MTGNRCNEASEPFLDGGWRRRRFSRNPDFFVLAQRPGRTDRNTAGFQLEDAGRAAAAGRAPGAQRPSTAVLAGLGRRARRVAPSGIAAVARIAVETARAAGAALAAGRPHGEAGRRGDGLGERNAHVAAVAAAAAGAARSPIAAVAAAQAVLRRPFADGPAHDGARARYTQAAIARPAAGAALAAGLAGIVDGEHAGQSRCFDRDGAGIGA